MVIDVYIGRLDSVENGTFKWDGGDYSGNTPNRISPYFPYGYETIKQIWKIIDSGQYDGKQLDWGAWGVKMDKQSLLMFIDDCRKQHSPKDYRELYRFVNKKLESGVTYVLVGAEGIVSDCDD